MAPAAAITNVVIDTNIDVNCLLTSESKYFLTLSNSRPLNKMHRLAKILALSSSSTKILRRDNFITKYGTKEKVETIDSYDIMYTNKFLAAYILKIHSINSKI